MRNAADRLKSALAGRYTLERELGKGASATVYLAQDLKHGRKVAIKVLRPELAAALGTERFVREIAIAANLTHPHILPLFDSGEADGFLYYVMPYIEGETLRQRLQRDTRLSVAEAVRLTDQIAAALSYAHQQGVVHRDVKPENILLVHDQAIVADFGIARAVEAAGGDGLTRTGFAIGTPAYMSPEQAFGHTTVDGRTDVYALGCVVFEMVSGRSPLEGLEPASLLARLAEGKLPGLRATNPEIPLFVERAIERALATDPSDRFPGAEAFAEALNTGKVIARVRRPVKLSWRVASAAALVLLIAGWGVSAVIDASRIRRLAVLPLEDLTGDSAQAYLVAGVHDALIKELGKLGLTVTARTTMRRYLGSEKSIGEIARELGVQGVIEGSFFRKGDSLEISARLYDRAEQEIWNGSYDGDLPNATALYRGFARAIADKIHAKLSPVAEAGLARPASVNPAVYEAYLRGMYILHNLPGGGNVHEALRYFEEAIEADPANPLAYTGAAAAYVQLGHSPAPPPDVWPRARANAERALRLDSTIAEVWSAIARVKYYYEWDWEGAERAFRRANELNPSLPDNHYHYAWYLLTVGRGQEGIPEHHIARELDPLTPVYTVWLAGMYQGMGDYERAIAEAKSASERFPDHPILLLVMGRSALELGRHDEAIAAHERLASIDPRWRFAIGVTYALTGRKADAMRIANELEALTPSSWNALNLAKVHAALGNRDAALRWLEYEPRHAFWMGIGGDPVFDPLRGNPRFDALVKRLNLPRGPRRQGVDRLQSTDD